MKHANILLAVDTANGKTKDSDENIAKQFHCHINTVCNVKQCFVEEGFESVLNRKQRETSGVTISIYS
ncbi:MAG: helix-turn-helix domain-containing protein [Planctomycetaceae bacterium]|nr:helix-turn-helix domain-containing protein [Planctomycetaceae bacterium]